MSTRQILKPLIVDGKPWDHYFYDSKTGIIYYEARIDGKRIKFSTKEKIPSKAKIEANRELKKRLGLFKQNVRTLVKEELKAWLLFKESEGHKQDTLNNIRRAKKQIEEYWGDKLPSDITRDSFAEWCAWWKENHSDIQMENAVKYFNNFCRYLHEKVVNGRPLLASILYFQDPNRKLIKAKRAKKKERVFTPEEFQKVHATAVNEVEALAVMFMYTMATRIDETLNLNFSERINVDREMPTYQWTVDDNKAGLIGQHFLHQSLIAPTRSLYLRRLSEKTDLLFPQKQDNLKPLREQMIDWEAWRKRADLGWHWTPHTFRHTCLTMLFNNKDNPQAVICKLYRVSIQTAMQTYIKVTDEAKLAIKDSIEVLSWKA